MVDALHHQPTGMVHYLVCSVSLHVHTVASTLNFGEMEIKVLLILLLGVATVCSQDSPCSEEAITGNGTDVSLAVRCSSFTPVVSYHAAGIVPGDGKFITVSIGYTCTNSTGAVIADDFIATSAIAPTKTKTFTTSFTTGTECTFSGCYFLAKLFATPVEYHSLAILPTPCTVDFDECLAGTHNCDVNAECVNTLGSYQCQCRFGYEGNGTQCTNIDECTENTHNCSNAMCFDTEGSYNCTCNPGYETSDPFTCTNIDECIESEHNCSANAKCTDTEGSYNCTCETGYESNGFTCKNIDECIESDHNCSVNATCTDTEGSYNCTCEAGYEGNGFICKNIDECIESEHNCSTNANCTDSEGSYSCTCDTGYEGNGFTCKNIDECIESDHNCSVNATCTDTEGSYNCTCEAGYEGNGFICKNIDECIKSEHNCSANANCTDTEGSYYCTCETGYEGNGFTCTNIDECIESEHNCSTNAICTDTEGSYYCTCDTVYEGNGFTCTTITECLECDVNALCVSTEDTYTCVCDEGYDGDGFTCRSTEDSKPWIPGLSSMAAVTIAVVIAVMALVVFFVLGKRKSLFQIAECIGCTKKNDPIYNQEVDLDYIPVDPDKSPYDHICLQPTEIFYRLEQSSVDEDTKRSTTCLTELKIITAPSGQGDNQNKTPAWIIPIHVQSPSERNFTLSSDSTSDDSIATPKSASPSLDCSDNCEAKLQLRKSGMRTTALPSVTGDESGFVESDAEGYMYIPTSSSFSESNESDQKELSDGASIQSGLSYNIHVY